MMIELQLKKNRIRVFFLSMSLIVGLRGRHCLPRDKAIFSLKDRE